jgi:CheY-like chemotaxis protein
VALIILDVNLPDVNGAEVFERLKADPLTAGIPVAVASAGYNPDLVSRFARAGEHLTLNKPISLTTIRELLARIAADAEGSGAPQS